MLNITPNLARKLIKSDARHRIVNRTKNTTAHIIFELFNPYTKDWFHVVDGRMLDDDWEFFAINNELEWTDIRLSECDDYVIKSPKYKCVHVLF